MAFTPAGAVVRQMCRDFPDAGTRTLATKLWNQERKLFNSYEHCRSLIRLVRGEKGEKARRQAVEVVPTTKGQRKLPASLYRPINPYVFKQKGSGVVISDLHVPYHDEAAIHHALDYCVKRKHTDFVIINGDLCDIHTLSRFEKDPREKDFPGEIEAVEEMLDVLAQTFGTIYFKYGNHENRWQSYMWAKAPELLGVSEFELSALLHLPDRNVVMIDDNQIIYVGSLNILHGHEFGGAITNPVNPARGTFLRAKASAICGHHHQCSEHTEGTIRGKEIVTWSTGCLCGRMPKYRPLAFTKWNHGFALLSFDGKEYEIENKKIVDGKVR